METSIVIRVRNEAENLKKLFGILQRQTYQDFEIVIVDNESTDGSAKVVFDYFPGERVQIVKIADFSYPKACNLGAQIARGKFLVYISAHSFPISDNWLADGLSHFADPKVAGVASHVTPGKDGTIWERVFTATPIALFKLGLRTMNLGNTNCIIRKDLWKVHNFDERLKWSSEDLEWSIYWQKRGYKIIYDPRFAVFHSHKLGPLGLLRTEIKWKRENMKIKGAKLLN